MRRINTSAPKTPKPATHEKNRHVAASAAATGAGADSVKALAFLLNHGAACVLAGGVPADMPDMRGA